MKLYLVIVLVLCGSYADDELPEDFASLLSQLSDDFNLQLQKRLTDLDPDLSLQDKDHKVDKAKLLNDKGSTCFYQVSEQRIIRTHDSLNNGATYIDSPTDIQNVTACRAECCSRSECDLAVFKDKGDEHACYLFACSGACLFTNHTGFTTMEKHRMAQQHEDDLANLATDPPSTLKPATTAATTKTTETSSTTPSPDKVPLFGACIEDSDCAESKAECLAGYCVCQQGSHAQEGVCREECSRFQFECANEGKPLSYPQCIAIYDTCDGIPHCRDGSDELKCEPRGISSSDSKSVLSGGGLLQDNQAFSDRQQLQPWQQQFLQQQQQQQLLKSGYIPQLLGQQPLQSPLYNVGQQQASLPGYIQQLQQQIPQQVPGMPVQGQAQLAPQYMGPRESQSQTQNLMPSQGLVPSQDLSLVQPNSGVQSQPNMAISNQQIQSNIQSQAVQQQLPAQHQHQPLPQQSQQIVQQPQQPVQPQQSIVGQQQQVPVQPSLSQGQGNIAPAIPQAGSNSPGVGVPLQNIPQQQQQQLQPNIAPPLMAQVPAQPRAQQPTNPLGQSPNQPLIPQRGQSFPVQGINGMGGSYRPPVMPNAPTNQQILQQQQQQQQQPLPQQAQTINQNPLAAGGREVDFPSGHHIGGSFSQQARIPVHADHMQKQQGSDTNNPPQQQAITLMPPGSQQDIYSGDKAITNTDQSPRTQQDGLHLSGPNKDFIPDSAIPGSFADNAPIQNPPSQQQQPGQQNQQQPSGPDLLPQGPPNPASMGLRKQKPLGQISYTDGGAVVADSQPPMRQPGKTGMRKLPAPGVLPPPNQRTQVGDASQPRQGDYGRGNWRGRVDPYLNPKSGYSLDQYGTKTKPQRGYNGDRYPSYNNYDTNPYPQGYPSNDQFYAYYDTDTPNTNTHNTDYDYQYAAGPSVGVENSYDELASLVEELLKSEDNDGAALSQSAPSTDDGGDGSNRDGAFWDYYDSSSYIPSSNGRKTQNQGSAQPGIDNGYQNRRPVNAGGKGLPSRPQAPEQRINPNQGTQGRVPERDGTYRTDPQRPYLGNRDNSRAPDSSALGRQNQQPAGQNKPDYDSAGKQKKLQPNVPMPPPQNAQSNVPAEVPKSTNNDKNNGAPETPTPAQPTPEPTGTTAQPAAAATGAPAGLKTSSAPVTATQSSSGEHKKPDHSGNAGAAVASKHVAPEVLLNDAEKEPALKASNKTAVVVLAMGLAVTALLLIFVGCRLRMVKRRLRRGRPLNSNEADYLINGMYL